MPELYAEYRQRLIALAEPQYRDFSASLIPNADNLLGVRIPAVRKLAAQLAKDDWRAYFDENEDVYFEETLLQGLTIGYLKDIDVVLSEAARFIPKISNWAICDSFCGGLKITKTHRERVWDFLMDYIASDKPYSPAELLIGHARLISNSPLYAKRLDALIKKSERAVRGLSQSVRTADAPRLAEARTLLASLYELKNRR